MNFEVLLTVLVGIIFGYRMYETYGDFLIAQILDMRRLLDTRYHNLLMDFIDDPKHYDDLEPEYNLLPYDKHLAAIQKAGPTQIEYSKNIKFAVLKQLLIRFTAILLIPSLIFIYTQTAAYFLITVLITIVAMMVYEIYIVRGKSYIAYMRLAAIVIEMYQNAGYHYDFKKQSYMKERHVLKKPIASPHNKPNRYSQAPLKRRLRRELTFNNIWWGIDALVSSLMVYTSWIMTGHDAYGYIIMPFIMVLFVQIFFIPMYFVIRIARRLWYNNPSAT